MSRILVVDDDADVRAALSMVLELGGHECELYGNVRDALGRQRDAKFDVIILDQMMPGMTGTDYCHELRARSDDTPVIFLSADRDIETRAGGLKQSKVIKKPFDMDELLGAIDSFSTAH